MSKTMPWSFMVPSLGVASSLDGDSGAKRCLCRVTAELPLMFAVWDSVRLLIETTLNLFCKSVRL